MTPVRGMVAISPPEEGNLLPTWVAARMIRRLMMSLIADYIAPFLTMAMRGGGKGTGSAPWRLSSLPGGVLIRKEGGDQAKSRRPRDRLRVEVFPAATDLPCFLRWLPVK